MDGVKSDLLRLWCGDDQHMDAILEDHRVVRTDENLSYNWS